MLEDNYLYGANFGVSFQKDSHLASFESGNGFLSSESLRVSLCSKKVSWQSEKYMQFLWNICNLNRGAQCIILHFSKCSAPTVCRVLQANWAHDGIFPSLLPDSFSGPLSWLTSSLPFWLAPPASTCNFLFFLLNKSCHSSNLCPWLASFFY